MVMYNSLINQDARLLTKVISPTNPCVDVVITSPPYWNLKNYGSHSQIGYGQTKEEYISDTKKVLKNCFIVTKSTGSLWLIVDTYREDGELQLLPMELAECAHKVGWKLRDIIIWDKHHSVPWHSKGQLRNTYEFILFMTKSDSFKYYIDRIKTLDEISKWWVDFPERFNPKGKTPTNIWSIPIRPRGSWRKPSKLNHYCSFPTALVTRIIELTTDSGDLVMDPFAGSGVVLAQAASLGRQYIGFEVNTKYVQMFNKTVKKEVNEDWEELKVWRKILSQAKVDFEKTVLKLRALKYSRQVTKPFLEVLEPNQTDLVKAILCLTSIPKKYQRGSHFYVKIIIIIDHNIPDFERAIDKARKRSLKPPLTQYEIRSDILIETYFNLKRQNKLLNKMFYLYPDYRPHKYKAKKKLKTWFEKGKLSELADKKKIPMLTNFAVDVSWVLKK